MVEMIGTYSFCPDTIWTGVVYLRWTGCGFLNKRLYTVPEYISEYGIWYELRFDQDKWEEL